MQHVFYFDEPKHPRWKVVLHKEPRSKRVMAKDNEDVTLHDNVIGVDVPFEVPQVARNMALVGAIELSGANAILTNVELQRLNDDDDSKYE
jgi:hypothetical protein